MEVKINIFTFYRLIFEVYYYSGRSLKHLLASIKSLEKNIIKERASFCMQIQKLKTENTALLLKVQQLSTSANKKSEDGCSGLKRRNRTSSTLRSRSRSSSISSRNKTTSSLSSGVY